MHIHTPTVKYRIVSASTVIENTREETLMRAVTDESVTNFRLSSVVSLAMKTSQAHPSGEWQ